MAYHVRRCDLVGSHLFADLCHIYHACFSYRHTYAFGNSGYFHGIFVVIIATLTYAEAVAKLVSSKQVVSPT